jgi:hypothetical protein
MYRRLTFYLPPFSMLADECVVETRRRDTKLARFTPTCHQTSQPVFMKVNGKKITQKI